MYNVIARKKIDRSNLIHYEIMEIAALPHGRSQ